MKIIFGHLSVFVLICCIKANCVSATSPVWEISKGGNKVYIGGTIHLLKTSDYPLPSAFDKAFLASEILVFETDIEYGQSAIFQQKVMQKLTLPSETKLNDVIKPNTLAALEKHLSERGAPLGGYYQFRPALISISLTVNELRNLGMAEKGVDQYYFEKGKMAAYKMLFLETPEEQLEYISNLGKGHEDELILHTIKDLKKLPETMLKLKSAWRSGDNSTLYQVALSDWEKEFPSMFDQILIERNNNWIPEIEQMLNTTPVEFVLVGALHLAGPKGLLKQLVAGGYSVKQL